jgi:aminobenzoyl-glutamate utilization protein B
MDKKGIFDAIALEEGRFAAHAKALWDSPELSFMEKNSSALQKRLCESLGFKVTSLDAVQNYAFTAEFGSGKPVIGILGEFDALPGLSQKINIVRDPVVEGGPGHGCGHNLLGTASLAAAYGVKKALESGAISGTVKYFGCPAEEQLGKPVLAAAGVFAGLDAVLCWHPADLNTVAAYGTNASVQLEFRFKGKPAHAAQVPHMGRSALDALTLTNVGLEFLREHMPSQARVHYIVTSGGERANIVPEFASGVYQVRSPCMKEVVSLIGRVLDVARGAALMTGTNFEYKLLHGCYDVSPNGVISDILYENLNEAPLPSYSAEDKALAAALCATTTEDQRKETLLMLGVDALSAASLAKLNLHEGTGYWGKQWVIPASTDVGDVSHIAPTSQINTATWPMGVGSHTWQATSASGSGIGMKGMIYAAQVMAGAACDLFASPEKLAAAKREFDATMGGEVYAPAADLIGKGSGLGSGA